jgi:molecular chaperone GrpE
MQFGKLRKVETQNPEPIEPDVSNAAGETSAEEKTAALAAERDRLAAEKADLQDRLLRKQAEFDNFRRRGERERSEFYQFASMEVVRDLLPLLDDFERAVKAPGASEEYAKGVELIYSRFFETLKKTGLEPIETAGKKFDPNLHEAIGRVESEEAEDQAILSEMQRGYLFKGKLLRPAWVQVAVKP